MRRVTADSNIYISALNFGGKPQQVLELARTGDIELTISNAIIAETSRILRQKFHWESEDINDLMERLLRFCKYVHPDHTLNVVPTDPDDNRVLECAVTAGSDTVVTGDKDLLVLGSFKGITIQTPADFLAELQSRDPREDQ